MSSFQLSQKALQQRKTIQPTKERYTKLYEKFVSLRMRSRRFSRGSENKYHKARGRLSLYTTDMNIEQAAAGLGIE